MSDVERPIILLVEDEPLIQDPLISSLEEGGFGILLAPDGTRALDALHRELDQLTGLVTDVDLGEGPSGWDVAREGRRLNPGLAVVYMSGASAHEWEAEGVPGSTILGKPFAPAQLLVALAEQLNTANASRADG